MSEKPSKAQRWILERLAEGLRVVPAGAYEFHTSFASGEVYYGAPKQAFDACVRRGFVDSGAITEAGRAALLPTP